MIAEPLRLLVYTSAEWDAFRRRKVDLGGRAAGLGWKHDDFIHEAQRNDPPSHRRFPPSRDEDTSGDPISERLSALAESPDAPVLATPEEAAALRTDLQTLRAVTLRPVAWRLCAGVLPAGSVPGPDGAMPVAAARNLIATLKDQRNLALVGLLGQSLAGSVGQNA